MTGNDVEKLLTEGCTHTIGMHALATGPVVCLACFKAALDHEVEAPVPNFVAELRRQRDEAETRRIVANRANASLRNEIEEMRVQLHRLAADALSALSASSVATPVEGYVAAPHCLKADILELVGRFKKAVVSCDIRRAETIELRRQLEDQKAVRELHCREANERATHFDMAREAAEKALLHHRDVLLNLKTERDELKARFNSAEKDVNEYHDKWREVFEECNNLRNNLGLVADFATALRGAK